MITPNLDHLRQFAHSRDLAALFGEADVVVADGMPLVWAARLAGTQLPSRVPGSDLIWSLTAEAAVRGHSVFLLGGAPGVGERAASTLQEHYPGAAIAGVHCPPFGFENDPAEVDLIRAKLASAAPDIVYVALGFPKQEHLIQALRREFPNTWFLGVGISLGFVSGAVPRAPDWLQSMGLEWVHRLVNEPRRLARRYLVHDLPFAVRLGLHSALARARGGLKVQLGPARPAHLPAQRVTFTHGALERRRAADLKTLRES